MTAERVWQELAKALMEARPSLFFEVLRRCGALGQLLPEVDALFGVPQPPAHHPEIDAGVHLMLALDFSAAAGDPLPVRYAVLAHDLGKATSDRANWPRHIAHEARSVALARRLSERLRVPADCSELARLVARYHGDVHRAKELRASTLLDLLLAADALRRPERLDGLLRACSADALSRPGRGGESYAPGRAASCGARRRARRRCRRDCRSESRLRPTCRSGSEQRDSKRLRAWEKANDGDARQTEQAGPARRIAESTSEEMRDAEVRRRLAWRPARRDRG